MALPTRQLGVTNLSVTRMGLGLAALGRPGYINLGHGDDLKNIDVDTMKSQAYDVLDVAWEMGIRYFDVARSYGKAEAFLGDWLRSRQILPETVTVGSKWGYTYTANWQVKAETHEVKEHSLAVLRRQWQETQTHLGDYLDLYQVHSATLDSGILDNDEVLDELAQLKSKGVAIGLSLSGAKQVQTLSRAVKIERNSARLFDCVQVTWNLLERSTTEILQAAHQDGMGVIVKEAVANGRLTPRNSEFLSHNEKFSEITQQVAQLETTVDAFALAGVLHQPWADVVLSGVAQVNHLQSNLRAFDVAYDGEIDTNLKDVSESSVDYWQTRDQLGWN